MKERKRLKGKALKRAWDLQSPHEAMRAISDVPLIVDTTELITPQIAQDMLEKNKNNRPINWAKVEEYAKLMTEGKWQLHSQGIILDGKDNIITGQKRLWAVVYSGVSVWMRVSRGCPSDTAWLIDRGTPQSARDLATRETERKHSPFEASIARGIAILSGQKNNIPPDVIARIIIEKQTELSETLKAIKGTKKTKAVLMVLSAAHYATREKKVLLALANKVEQIAASLERALSPTLPEECWGRGVKFVLALEQAKKCVEKEL